MNPFRRRIERLERALPPRVVMPDNIVIVRGRSWNPRIPPGYKSDGRVIIRRDCWGTLWQRTLFRPPDAVLDAAEGPDTVVLSNEVRYVGHFLGETATDVTMSSGGTSRTFKRDSIAMIEHDNNVANREAAEAGETSCSTLAHDPALAPSPDEQVETDAPVLGARNGEPQSRPPDNPILSRPLPGGLGER